MSIPTFINLYPDEIDTFVPEFSTDDATFIFNIFTLDSTKNPLTIDYMDTDVELLELGNSIYINLSNITELVVNHINDEEYKYDILVFINNVAKYRISLQYEFTDDGPEMNRKELFKYQNILKDIVEILYSYYVSGYYEHLHKLRRIIKKYELDDEY